MKKQVIKIFTALSFMAFSPVIAQNNVIKIKPTHFKTIAIPEPSDIAYSPKTKNYFVVSDDGYLFEMNENGDVLRKADFKGLDCEAVFADKENVYVVEEMARRINVFDAISLKKSKTLSITYNGGRNRAFEAMTYNPYKKVFLLITEKKPATAFELNEDLNVINEVDFSKLAKDISAATFHQGHLFILSDEDMTITKLNPENYEVITVYKIPVLNPEGLTFDENGNLMVISDDLQRIYYFNQL